MSTLPAEPEGRPEDVDTGFWLWVVALPLLVTGHIIDVLFSREQDLAGPLLAASLVIVAVLAAVVLTFMILMRHGYRWARTVLTGGGLASVVYVVTNLFSVERSAAVALAYAVTAILGSVLIVGGVFLLHRKDAHAYFTR
ncbi:hypothetical protein [Mycobacterium sp. IDR2000157661]|uniref:hypothetical protein n=1 Tax=Mycobacterium sp. IDR2000157661 TaxID=2867005 RepID=UPI001EEC3EE2|nr:hypothetical protein [Mycobacterium sp. IDR2000157661]ULE34191.1 hypothetical protein K3G64_05940 [Mycobacterium sp. IDR2000157661]